MFQFTQPKRAATLWFNFYARYGGVSIHAAQAGCDLGMMTFPKVKAGFNSRSPSGLRRGVHKSKISKAIFQFTQPKRAATGAGSEQSGACGVSIHAAQAGCDLLFFSTINTRTMFQFTQPKRAATKVAKFSKYVAEFQFTQPKRAATNAPLNDF